MKPGALFAAAYDLAGGGRIASEELIDGWFRDATPRTIASVAAVARTAFRYTVWPGHVRLQGPLDDTLLDAFDASARLAVAALLSMHRNGYVRDLGCRFLATSPDARVVPCLLLREDDIVPSLRAASDHAITERLRPELALTFARSLGLVELLGTRLRGGNGPLVRSIHEFLGRPEHRDALRQASHDEDPTVRRAAFALRLRKEPAEAVLRAALGDPDTRIRRFAARAVVARSTSRETMTALLPVVGADRSSSLRILALRGWQALDSSDAPIEGALFDHNADVRYRARSILRTRQPGRPFGETRTRALAVLGEPGARLRELVGALGALADVGLRSDVTAVARFGNDPRPRLREEARRTMSWLER